MVDTLLLENEISKSGKKKTYLAKRMNISIQGLRLKMKNVYPFDTDEVSVLCEELNIKKLTDKERIFFAKNVENVPTNRSENAKDISD